MVRISLLMGAVILTVTAEGCTHCDTCDDFPLPNVGGMSTAPLAGSYSTTGMTAPTPEATPAPAATTPAPDTTVPPPTPAAPSTDPKAPAVDTPPAGMPAPTAPAPNAPILDPTPKPESAPPPPPSNKPGDVEATSLPVPTEPALIPGSGGH
jgi:hypothetical protein